jgi:hypothetical protein
MGSWEGVGGRGGVTVDAVPLETIKDCGLVLLVQLVSVPSSSAAVLDTTATLDLHTAGSQPGGETCHVRRGQETPQPTCMFWAHVDVVCVHTEEIAMTRCDSKLCGRGGSSRPFEEGAHIFSLQSIKRWQKRKGPDIAQLAENSL